MENQAADDGGKRARNGSGFGEKRIGLLKSTNHRVEISWKFGFIIESRENFGVPEVHRVGGGLCWKGSTCPLYLDLFYSYKNNNKITFIN